MRTLGLLTLLLMLLAGCTTIETVPSAQLMPHQSRSNVTRCSMWAVTTNFITSGHLSAKSWNRYLHVPRSELRLASLPRGQR